MKRLADPVLVDEVVSKASKVESVAYSLSEGIIPKAGDPTGPQGRRFHPNKASADDLLRETLGLLDSALTTLQGIATNKPDFICYSDPPGIRPDLLDDPYIDGLPGDDVTDQK